MQYYALDFHCCYSFPSLRPRTQYYGMIQRSTIRFHCSYIYVHKYCRSWFWHRTSGSSHPIFFYASLFDSPKGITRAPDLYRLCTTSDSSAFLLQLDCVLYNIFASRGLLSVRCSRSPLTVGASPCLLSVLWLSKPLTSIRAQSEETWKHGVTCAPIGTWIRPELSLFR